MIECLVCHVDKRFTVDMMLDLEIFSKLNFNTLHDQVPPYIPSLSSDNDVSNFPIHERVRPALKMNDFKVCYKRVQNILYFLNINFYFIETKTIFW